MLNTILSKVHLVKKEVDVLVKVLELKQNGDFLSMTLADQSHT